MRSPDWKPIRPVHRDRAGVTLIELMIAAAVLVIIMGSAVGLLSSQRDIYDTQSDMARLQRSVRSAVDLVAGEIRTMPSGGLVAADDGSLTIRFRIRQGAICAPVETAASDVHMYLGSQDELFADHVQSGFAMMEPDDSLWTFYPETDPLPVVMTLASDSLCTIQTPPAPKAKKKKKDDPEPEPETEVVADTAADPKYVRFLNITNYVDSIPEPKTLVIVYSEVTYEFADSEFEPGTQALFRLMPGVRQELAGLFSTEAGFEYVLKDGSVVSTATGDQLTNVAEVRIKALGEKQSQLSGKSHTRRYDATVNVPLRNRRGDS